MTRTLFSAVIIASVFSQVLGGPACAKKYENSPECMALCKSGTNWGFKGDANMEGMFLGNLGMDAWGIVLTKSGMSLDDWIAQACGKAASSTSFAAPTSTSQAAVLSIAGGAVDNESTTSSTTSTSSTPSTTSTSSTSTSSTSTTPKTTSTPKPTTSSTPPPEPKTTSTPPPEPSTTSSSKKAESTPANNDNDNDNKNNNNNNNNNRGGGGGGSTSGSDREQWLSLHNSLRSQHGAGSVSWSDAAEAAAQKWANNCKFQHSGGSLGPFGENLAAGTGANYGVDDAFKSWADEEPEYNPGSPKASHYTQVVWKATSQIGCAVAECTGIFGGSEQSKYYVCEYSEQGNVIGAFGENVQ